MVRETRGVESASEGAGGKQPAGRKACQRPSFYFGRLERERRTHGRKPLLRVDDQQAGLADASVPDAG
jgi:hypothetical protein